MHLLDLARLGAFTLPLVPDPAYPILSAELLVSEQLVSWGVRLGPVSLSLGLSSVAPRATYDRPTHTREGSPSKLKGYCGYDLNIEPHLLRVESIPSPPLSADDNATVNLLPQALQAGQVPPLLDSEGKSKSTRGGFLASLGRILGWGSIGAVPDPTPTLGSSPSDSRPADEGGRGLLQLDVGVGLGLGPRPGLGLGEEGGLGIGVGIGAGVGQEGDSGWGRMEGKAKAERGGTEGLYATPRLWLSYITVGTPPQSIPVLLDTGSSDSFIFSSSCLTCPNPRTQFDAALSKTFQPARDSSNAEWSTIYADGSGARGTLGRDILSFGSASSDTRAGEGPFLDFALATQLLGGGWDTSSRAGVLGLGQDAMVSWAPESVWTTLGSGRAHGYTLFSALVKERRLARDVLSVKLDKGVVVRGKTLREGGGKFVFGEVQGEYVRGGEAGIDWMKVTSAAYWGFDIDDVTLGEASVLLTDKAPRRAIVDTGTTLIIISPTAAATLHARIPGASQDINTGIFYVPCDLSRFTTPSASIVVNGRRYGVPAEDLAWKPSASETRAGMCVSGVQGGDQPFFVLGTVFIKNAYVVLRYGDEDEGLSVGLGKRSDLPLLE